MWLMTNPTDHSIAGLTTRHAAETQSLQWNPGLNPTMPQAGFESSLGPNLTVGMCSTIHCCRTLPTPARCLLASRAGRPTCLLSVRTSRTNTSPQTPLSLSLPSLRFSALAVVALLASPRSLQVLPSSVGSPCRVSSVVSFRSAVPHPLVGAACDVCAVSLWGQYICMRMYIVISCMWCWCCCGVCGGASAPLDSFACCMHRFSAHAL